MDAVKLRKRVVELQEQLSSCIQAHGGEVSSLKNEIASLSLSVEQREAENQRLQLTVENLERDLRKTTDALRKATDDKNKLHEEKTTSDELLNKKFNELSEKCLQLQRNIDHVNDLRRTEREQHVRQEDAYC